MRGVDATFGQTGNFFGARKDSCLPITIYSPLEMPG